MKINLRELLLVFAFALMVQTISAQTESQDDEIKKREIISNVFTKSRPAPTRTSISTPTPLPRKNYKGKKVLRAKSKRKTPEVKPIDVPNKERLGVTLWRLRSEGSSDTGARLLTMGKSSKLIAERVSFETSFRLKEKVRLSIETPRDCYLYVVDRELHKDGTLGDAYLIFPTLRTRNGNNRIGKGTVIEIPSQSDDPPYFDITPLTENYAGEMLTVIVSSTPLPNLQLQNEPLAIPAATIAKWQEEWEETVDVFELEDGEKMQYTEGEKKAGLRLLFHA
jgi:hypothetical protein